MNEKMDMRISGSSTMPGGEYDRVSIRGSGTCLLYTSPRPRDA